MPFNLRHAWGMQAVALGAWEAYALTGHAPTVTSLVRRSRDRRRRRTEIAVALWLIGLGVHLLRRAV